MMRLAPIVQLFAVAGLAAAVLVACGGDGALAPVVERTPAAIATENAGLGTSSGSGLSGVNSGPTPVVVATPVSAPTPTSVTATPITGLPSASPAAVPT